MEPYQDRRRFFVLDETSYPKRLNRNADEFFVKAVGQAWSMK